VCSSQWDEMFHHGMICDFPLQLDLSTLAMLDCEVLASIIKCLVMYKHRQVKGCVEQ
jgi:hypothetical protein